VHTLGLESLYSRRVKADLVMCYKILNNHVCVDVDSLFTRGVGYHTRVNCVKLYKTHTASVRDSHFFSNRVINVWNSLPDTVVSSGHCYRLQTEVEVLIGLTVLTVSWLCNLGASIRAGLLPWCPVHHIFVFPVLLTYCWLFVIHRLFIFSFICVVK